MQALPFEAALNAPLIDNSPFNLSEYDTMCLADEAQRVLQCLAGDGAGDGAPSSPVSRMAQLDTASEGDTSKVGRIHIVAAKSCVCIVLSPHRHSRGVIALKNAVVLYASSGRCSPVGCRLASVLILLPPIYSSAAAHVSDSSSAFLPCSTLLPDILSPQINPSSQRSQSP